MAEYGASSWVMVTVYVFILLNLIIQVLYCTVSGELAGKLGAAVVENAFEIVLCSMPR